MASKLLVHSTGNTATDLARIKGNKAVLAVKRNAGDPDARQLDALFGAITAIARATGDAANIAVPEREFLRNFVLTPDDSIESGNAVLDQAERILNNIITGHGIPVPEGKTKPTSEMSDEELLKELSK